MPPPHPLLTATSITHAAPWLLFLATSAVGVLSLYRQRNTWQPYRRARRTIAPPVLAIASDDWGGDDPQETPQQIHSLTQTLLSVQDAQGHPAVLTAYLNPAAPDHHAVHAANYQQYAWCFCYQNHPQLTVAWRQAINTSAIDLQFHAREHCNISLWLDLLQNDTPGFREASRQSHIPYLHDKHWPDAVQNDPRLKLLFRSFVDASQTPPRALPIQTQRVMIQTGIDLIKTHLHVTPTVITPPGYIFDSNTCAALADSTIRYIDTIRTPRRIADAQNQIHESTIIDWNTDLHGLGPIIRGPSFEPTWPGGYRPAQKTPPDRIAEKIELAHRQIKQTWACGNPAVLTSHKHNYIGPDLPAARAGRQALAQLLNRVRREQPNVLFLSTTDLAQCIHHPRQPTRRNLHLTQRTLTTTTHAANTLHALWSCHSKFRYWVYATAVTLTLAIANSTLNT